MSNVDIDNKAKSSVKNVPRNENCIKLMEFASHMEKLLAEDRYIARSDYKKYIDEYQKSISFFEVLSDSGMLGNFCDVNGVEERKLYKRLTITIMQRHMLKTTMRNFLPEQWSRKKNIWIMFLRQ